MPDDVKSKMESSFGTDFSGVNIHANSGQATNIGALAYTQGNDVHFAPGQFNPGSTKGQELLGHELTHVVQQRQGRVRPDAEQHKSLNINSDTSLEKEADEMGAKAAQGKMADVSGIGKGVQRQEDNETIEEETVLTFDEKIANGTISATVDGEYLKVFKDSVQKNKIKISSAREYLLKNYNWSGIVKLMKAVADKTTNFTYTTPTDLKGNTEDDIKIIPDDALKYIALLQLNYNIDEDNDLINGLDGKAGDNFIKNIISGEGDENSYDSKLEFMNQESDDLTDYDFSQNLENFDGSTNKKEMYDALQGLIEVRNGLWSTEDRIVNIVVIKKEEGSRNTTEKKLITNDYFFTAYKDGETYEVSKFIGSADPGKEDNGMIMPNQTVTLTPGFHQGYQPGARTENIVRKKKNSSDNEFQTDAGMNNHKANSTHGLFYRNSDNVDFKPYKVDGKGTNGWLYRDGDNFKKISDDTDIFKKEEEITADKEYKVKKSEGEDETIYTLVLGKKPKLTLDSDDLNDSEFKIYKLLTELQRTMINYSKKYDDLTSTEKTIIDNLISDIDDEIDDIKISYEDESGAEQTMSINYKTQLERYVRDSDWSSDIVATSSTKVDRGFSEGCHVFPSSKDYYNYLNTWQQFAFSDDDSKKTSQKRWYYNIVDLNTLNITSNEETTE